MFLSNPLVGNVEVAFELIILLLQLAQRAAVLVGLLRHRAVLAPELLCSVLALAVRGSRHEAAVRAASERRGEQSEEAPSDPSVPQSVVSGGTDGGGRTKALREEDCRRRWKEGKSEGRVEAGSASGRELRVGRTPEGRGDALGRTKRAGL